jgi:hypothetical protein
MYALTDVLVARMTHPDSLCNTIYYLGLTICYRADIDRLGCSVNAARPRQPRQRRSFARPSQPSHAFNRGFGDDGLCWIPSRTADRLRVGGDGHTAADAAMVLSLDTITVLATRTEEKAIDSLAGVSVISESEIEGLAPSRTGEIFAGVPSVHVDDKADDPATAISIRGLQDFGRVAVVIDGARQNFQRSGHIANCPSARPGCSASTSARRSAAAT